MIGEVLKILMNVKNMYNGLWYDGLLGHGIFSKILKNDSVVFTDEGDIWDVCYEFKVGGAPWQGV